MPALQTISALIITGIFLCAPHSSAQAQNCPANIDFENGDFSGWTCYAGTTASQGGQNVITFGYMGGPVGDQHTMYSANPGNGVDEYGGFPVNCPNGSGHSIRLGNNRSGTEAEGVSYDFTIPAGVNVYNLIYNYAVVFQDPGHQPSEQPRLEIEIMNLTDGTRIDCSSFTFFASGSILPGFELSSNPGGDTPVWFKKWTAVSINLDNLAGKTIRLFFKTADCTFRRHFGYAYVDVNTECSDQFEGAAFCPDDSVVYVNAPYGYQDYSWHNNTFTQVLGNAQTLVLDPPPAAGTTVAVILTPYNGYGCLDTLYANLVNTLDYTAEAGADKASCNNNLVQLGSPPKAGWNYSWSPGTGLNNSNISNPLASPNITTTYVLSIAHNGGGCRSTDSVLVKASVLDNTLMFQGKSSWCIGSGDSSVLSVPPADSIQWFKDNVPIAGANQPVFRVAQTGSYYAMVFNFDGCILSTTTQAINISSVPVAGFAVNSNNQCQLNNNFIFTNSSSNAVGNMNYQWIMGDGTVFNSRNVTYSYQQPGTYRVKMIVNSSSACADSSEITINVYPNVIADFTVAPVCVNLPLTPVNNTAEPPATTVSYLWDYGNGQTSTLRNPPATVYSSPGNYRVTLSVSSSQCPLPLNTSQKLVRVDKPATALRYPVKYSVINLPLTLQARGIGNEVLWTPQTYLDDRLSYRPTFRSAAEQEYTISLKTISGCATVDTQLVKMNKNIVIYVPNTFTPNADGSNDILRPFTIGIKELSYFKIYNRWGQVVFQTSQLDAGWDGQFKARPAEMQTVVWMLEGTGLDNMKYSAKGTSILLR